MYYHLIITTILFADEKMEVTKRFNNLPKVIRVGSDGFGVQTLKVWLQGPCF